MKRGFYEFPGRSKRQIYSVGAPRWFNPHRYGTVEAWYRSDAWTVDSRGFPFVGQILDLSGNGRHLSYFVENGQPVGLGIWDRNTYNGIPSFALFNASYVNSNVNIPSGSHRSVVVVFMPTRSVYKNIEQYPFALGLASYRTPSGDTNAITINYLVDSSGNFTSARTFTYNPTVITVQTLIDFTLDRPNVWQAQWNGSALRLMQNGGSVASTSASWLGPAGPHLTIGDYTNKAYIHPQSMFIFEIAVWSTAVDMAAVNSVLQRQYRTGRV